MRRVLIESPFAGETERETERNQVYARFCMHDSVTRFEEAPYASHLLFTQEFILDDDVPEERRLGIDAGLEWGRAADVSAVYVDLGVSTGMAYGIRNARTVNRRVVDFRQLPEDAWEDFRLICVQREYLVPERAYPPLTLELVEEINDTAMARFRKDVGVK